MTDNLLLIIVIGVGIGFMALIAWMVDQWTGGDSSGKYDVLAMAVIAIPLLLLWLKYEWPLYSDENWKKRRGIAQDRLDEIKEDKK